MCCLIVVLLIWKWSGWVEIFILRIGLRIWFVLCVLCFWVVMFFLMCFVSVLIFCWKFVKNMGF